MQVVLGSSRLGFAVWPLSCLGCGWKQGQRFDAGLQTIGSRLVVSASWHVGLAATLCERSCGKASNGHVHLGTMRVFLNQDSSDMIRMDVNLDGCF